MVSNRKTTIEVPSIDDEISIRSSPFSKYLVSMRMPKGMTKRTSNGNMSKDDTDFIGKVLMEYTSLSSKQLQKADNEDILYIVDSTLRFILEKDLKDKDDFINEDGETEFINQGSLGVK